MRTAPRSSRLGAGKTDPTGRALTNQDRASATSGPNESLSGVGREVRAQGAAGIAGLVFSGLFVASFLLLRRQPPSDASLRELKDFYGSGNDYLSLVGLYLAPFAGIAFLWFLAVARHRVSDRGDRFFDTVFLGSGVLFVAMLFAWAAAAGSVPAGIQFHNDAAPSPGGLALVRALADAFLFTFGVKSAGVFMMVTSTIGLRTGRLPRWFVYPSWLLAAFLLFSVSFFEPIVLVFPIWVAALSLLILLGKGLPQPPGAASSQTSSVPE